jgi:hypothetical protein
MNASDQYVKTVTTVADVARMVGLSRARFYQLQRAGVFPWPCYAVDTHRPIYTEEQQRECLEVRRRNCGINGQPVLFYARRLGAVASARRPARPRPSAPGGAANHDETVEYLRGLGLTRVTAEQIESALRAEYPQGTDGVDRGTILGRLFVRLHRQYSADNVGR